MNEENFEQNSGRKNISKFKKILKINIVIQNYYINFSLPKLAVSFFIFEETNVVCTLRC